jgi:cytoskeletal protein CcmA (bactofilin family)
VFAQIDIEGVLTVGATARVVAPVRADAVSVAGEIGGLVRANALVEVHVGGCIDGDVRAPQVTVDEGGQVTGRIERTLLKDTAVTDANVLGRNAGRHTGQALAGPFTS